MLLSIGVLAMVSTISMCSEDSIRNLTAQTFASEVIDSSHLWIVEFYIDPADRLARDTARAADALKGIAKFGAMDCSKDSTAKAIAERYGTEDFPTLLFFSQNLGIFGNEAPHTRKEITDFVINSIGTSQVSLISDSDTYLDFVNNAPSETTGTGSGTSGGATNTNDNGKPLPKVLLFTSKKTTNTNDNGKPLPKVLLFTSKKTTTLLYKALAVYFKDRMSFGEVRSYPSLADGFGIEKWPTLMVLRSSKAIKKENGNVMYEGPAHFDSIIDFLEPYAEPTILRNTQPIEFIKEHMAATAKGGVEEEITYEEEIQPEDSNYDDEDERVHYDTEETYTYYPTTNGGSAEATHTSTDDNTHSWLPHMIHPQEVGGTTFKEVNGMIFNAHALTEEEVLRPQPQQDQGES